MSTPFIRTIVGLSLIKLLMGWYFLFGYLIIVALTQFINRMFTLVNSFLRFSMIPILVNPWSTRYIYICP
jgi:hypothetical protein